MGKVYLSQSGDQAVAGGDLEVSGNIEQAAGYGAYAHIKTLVQEITLSGASTALTTQPGAGTTILGVTANVTTAITGAAGFTLGDGTDADKWGDITGTALGVHAGPDNWTAGSPTHYPSGPTITATAKSSNFTGGKLRVAVHYLEFREPKS